MIPTVDCGRDLSFCVRGGVVAGVLLLECVITFCGPGLRQVLHQDPTRIHGSLVISNERVDPLPEFANAGGVQKTVNKTEDEREKAAHY